MKAVPEMGRPFSLPPTITNFVQNNVHMLTASISDFRRDIKTYFDKVSDNFETLIINRGKGRGIVIMSLDEYNALCATGHELSSETNRQRLDSAIEKLSTGNGFAKEPIES
jgi:antitoxin YefM